MAATKAITRKGARALALGFALLAALLSGCDRDKPAARNPAANAGSANPPPGARPPAVATGPGPLVEPAPVPLKPAEFKLSAGDLCGQFKADEAAASAKYKGKVIEFTAIAASPGAPGDPDSVMVVSGAGDPKRFAFGPLVRCSMNADQAKRCDLLSQGQGVTVRGTCEGKSPPRAGTLLNFKECGILRVGPDPAPAATAPDLARAYLADPSAAGSRYGAGQTVVVSGTVRKLDDAHHVVWLAGCQSADGTTTDVRCKVAAVFYPDAQKHPPGQPITVKCRVEGIEDGRLDLVFGLVQP